MYRKDQVSQVNTSRANELAFAAQHAFHDFLFQVIKLTSLDKSMDPADVEFSEMPCRAGPGATSATHAKPDGRLYCINKSGYFTIIGIEINLPVFADRVPKGFHAG
jgi:hypothetical protein